MHTNQLHKQCNILAVSLQISEKKTEPQKKNKPPSIPANIHRRTMPQPPFNPLATHMATKKSHRKTENGK